MRRLATKTAVMGFFALGITGAMTGQEALTCTVRALAGAAVLFVLVKIAGRVVAAILTDAVTHSARRNEPTQRQERST